MRARLLLPLLVPLATGLSIVSCGAQDFDPQSLVHSVRVFATRSDKPYAAPGETVSLEVLAFDGRPDKRRPMKITWLPFVCENPVNDAYYACFVQAARAADAGAEGGAGTNAGAGGGPFSGLAPGVDLTPFLPSSATTTFTMPKNAITSHDPPKGKAEPYGLAILFNMACAGHLELVDDRSAGPQSVPIGCFDEDHQRLGAEDYVFGFTRVYAYATRRNANPEITGATLEGSPIRPESGIKVDRCGAAKRSDCPELKIDVAVSDPSWEINPEDIDPDGVVRHEQIWAAYYSDLGQFGSDARLLYDPRAGKIDGSETKYQAPNDPGDGNVWIVVHDNRGGVSWLHFPIHVR